MRDSIKAAVGVVCGIGSVHAIAAPPPTTTYDYVGATITTLDTDDKESWGNGVNKHGEVVGAYKVVETQTRPFFHDGTFIGIAGGSNTRDGEAFDINNSSEVVGWAIEAIGGNPKRAFYWKPGHSFELLDSNPYPNDQIAYEWHTWAYGINDLGQIVGGGHRQLPTWQPPPPQYCYSTLALRWASHTADPASIYCSPGAYPYSARDINNSGTIVVTDLKLTSTDMYRWKSGVYLMVPSPPAIPLYFTAGYGTPWGVNHLHHVVGDFQYETVQNVPISTRRAFVWDGVSAQSTLIGVLPGGTRSLGRDLNSIGVAVGASEKAHLYLRDVLHQVAIVWHKDFGMKALPTLPTTSIDLVPGECVAEAVSNTSDEGITYATGYCKSGGKKRAVRWDIQIVANTVGSSQQISTASRAR